MTTAVVIAICPMHYPDCDKIPYVIADEVMYDEPSYVWVLWLTENRKFRTISHPCMTCQKHEALLPMEVA